MTTWSQQHQIKITYNIATKNKIKIYKQQATT